MRALSWVPTFAQDLRYAARGLRKNPAFLSVVVLSLALGIGANSTIFSVMNALLYRPLPFPHADRLVAIWETPLGHPDDYQSPPIAELLDWKAQNHVFDDIALTSGTESATLASVHGSEAIRVEDVTPNYFDLLGQEPILGRIFTADEMQELTQTVVLSNSFWKTHFNGDPNVLGKTFTLRTTGILCTVVGVMAPGFADFYGAPVDLWQPINPANPRYAARQDHWLCPSRASNLASPSRKRKPKWTSSPAASPKLIPKPTKVSVSASCRFTKRFTAGPASRFTRSSAPLPLFCSSPAPTSPIFFNRAPKHAAMNTLCAPRSAPAVAA